MKKTYITPSVIATELKAEQMLAVSVGVKDDVTVGGNEAWSNHKAWSSENFMPGYEDEAVED